MKFWILNCVIGLVHLLVFCDANIHSVGYTVDYGARPAYERVLINDTNKVPKNYTIIYKYLSAEYMGIALLEIDVNVESEGHISGTDFNKLIEAKIHINNASNVIATIRIYRMGVIRPNLDSWLGEDYVTKSMTFIYKKNADSSRRKPFAQNAIGRRRQGDKLLHFESRNITNMNQFPSHAFEYSGSDFITYAAFSFNSPTAVAMINTSFIGEQEFNAIAYDMNTEHFVANMSVYGIKSIFRPEKFEGVI